MSFIDRAISYVSPRWSAQRQAWRRIENSYQGGVATRLSENWNVSQGFRFDSQDSRNTQKSMRDRGQNAYDNDPVARTLAQVETDNVIGDGLNYSPQSDSEEWNIEAKDRYYTWLENASVRGGDFITGCELERMLWEQSRVAGDIGWILVSRGPESRIQMIRSENIATPNDMLSDTAVYDGIRFDPTGAPVTYYVMNWDDRGSKGASQQKFTPISARDFVFLPHITKENQARGVSCYATILDNLAHLNRYIDGVSLAAWMATVFGIIFKQANSTTQYDALGLTTNSQGNQQKAVVMENGAVKFMNVGDDAVQVDAKQPMTQTGDFITQLMRQIGHPFHMPLEVLGMDMSHCNFASARIGLLPFYRHCRINAARFGYRWKRTIFWWLSRERQRADDDPKKWTTPFPANYGKMELLVNAWDYTDPVSEAQADLLQIDMGTKTRELVIGERGRDMELIDRQRQAEADNENTPEVHSTMTRDPTPDPVGPAGPAAGRMTDTVAGGNGNGNGGY